MTSFAPVYGLMPITAKHGCEFSLIVFTRFATLYTQLVAAVEELFAKKPKSGLEGVDAHSSGAPPLPHGIRISGCAASAAANAGVAAVDRASDKIKAIKEETLKALDELEKYKTVKDKIAIANDKNNKTEQEIGRAHV